VVELVFEKKCEKSLSHSLQRKKKTIATPLGVSTFLDKTKHFEAVGWSGLEGVGVLNSSSQMNRNAKKSISKSSTETKTLATPVRARTFLDKTEHFGVAGKREG
jgi:hypothetical protein